ncbi:hypothetical protein TTHERM_01289020 (macronuclear) [Tetrahymena thermophila SB210]|uniref:Uncharacterized protein n=1 Tax=Tetrahymena thermophila (strain SB210) TaxID=312017 RepID=Q22A39_TETTS|nr:hypothetical protein TTHERM_01289020 [Tetrahymena thermophila SB210]EAR82141.2 hypothetical protein TTHERM_01289020 [Tetrahymena thermophila SB210]|eukprot:XP_001029804.2 hypothetical protein TTHERM_01289020 [Tetrahymena thermophila SB210]
MAQAVPGSRKNLQSQLVNQEIIFKIDGEVIDQKEKKDIQYPRQLKFSTLKSKGFYNRSASVDRLRSRSNLKLSDDELNNSTKSNTTKESHKEKQNEDSIKKSKQIKQSERRTRKEVELDQSDDLNVKKRQISQKQQISPPNQRLRSRSQKDEEQDQKPQKRGRSISLPQRKKSIKPAKIEVVDQSSDTDGHLCECCVIDQFDPNRILKNKHHGADDVYSDSVESDSSCDSYCAKVLAEVAAKEVYDPSKIHMILNTKQFKEDQYYQKQELINQQNEFLRQQQEYQYMQQQQMQSKQRNSSINARQRQSQMAQQTNQQQDSAKFQQYHGYQSQTQPSSAQKQSQHGMSSNQQMDNLKDSQQKSQQQNSQIKSKQQNIQSKTFNQNIEKHQKSKSVHSLKIQENYMQQHLPEILQSRPVPQMEPAPKDKYKIQELIEEMIKQNNRIYKAEMQKSFQDKLEQKQAEIQRRENLKERIKFIQRKHREQFLKKQQEKEMQNYEDEEQKKLHEYQWGLDQRKFNPDMTKFTSKDKARVKKDQNLDEYFREFIDKVREKIKKRKQLLKKETMKRSLSSKKLFLEKDKKKQEKLWNSVVPKESAKKKKNEDEFDELFQQKKQKEIEKQQQILQERKQKYSTKNKRDLSNLEKEKVIEERGNRALSQIQKEKKEKENNKKKIKKMLKEIQQKAKKQLEKAKKREFNTLSEMNFEFSGYEDSPNQSRQDVQKKRVNKSVSDKENRQIYSQKSVELKQKQNTQNKSHQSIQNTASKNKKQNEKQSGQKPQQTLSQQSIQQKKEKQQKAEQIKEQEIQEQYHKNDSKSKERQKINEYDELEEEKEIDQSQYEKIQEENREKEQKVNQLVGSMSLKNIKIKSNLPQPHQSEISQIGNVTGQTNTQELPDDFVEKIFTTAEMKDLPKEFIFSQQKKEQKLTGGDFKKFEREIQNQIYKKNEKPIYHHVNQVKPQLKSEINVQKQNIPLSIKEEKARINNFEKKSSKPSQHLLQGEIVYKESKYEGVREIKHVPPKPRQISQEEYKKKQEEMNKVKIIEPAIPPIELRRRNEKQKSIKEKYLEEYNSIMKDEQRLKDQQIRKQQQYILAHDLEDDMFEMAQKAVYDEIKQKKAQQQKEVKKTFGFKDEDSDQELYAQGVDEYEKARGQILPDVLKNINKTNFASIIFKQKQSKSSQNQESGKK